MIEHIRNSLIEAQRALDAFIGSEQTLANIERAGDLLVNSFEARGKAFSCGNGAVSYTHLTLPTTPYV